ncbi:MAG: hypothetical protein KBT34_14915 [Prevotella sp.]|nr:hypothetical protein [Candidatus Prevotella equi]
MEYIDKSINEVQGDGIVKDFLAEVHAVANTYDVGHGLYDVIRFGSFAHYFHDIRNILYSEQNGRCCYCMRRLADKNKSVEHLIEKTFRPTDKWQDYMTPSTILNRKVCLEREFIKANQANGYSKFPHSVAYQNMVLSCKGWMPDNYADSKTCNLKRQHHLVAPFVLVDTINHDFYYKRNGFAYWDNDPHVNDPAINILKLNHNTLRMIRRIWFYAKDNHIDILKVTDRQAFLYGMLDVQIYDFDKDNTWSKMLLFLRDNYWNMLLEFDYFGTNRPNLV